MLLLETVILYMLVGMAVAVAVAVQYEQRAKKERLLLTITALLFWPVYLPVLLSQERNVALVERVAKEDSDDLSQMISQTEEELQTALESVEGWAGEVFARPRPRIEELHTYWKLQAERIREMDRLLAAHRTDEKPAVGEEHSRATRSEAARRENIGRIQKLRTQTHRDLIDTLAWVRELVSMIHLAKFSGAPASRAEELVGQIAAAVEGLSEVTQWDEELGSRNRQEHDCCY